MCINGKSEAGRAAAGHRADTDYVRYNMKIRAGVAVGYNVAWKYMLRVSVACSI